MLSNDFIGWQLTPHWPVLQKSRTSCVDRELKMVNFAAYYKNTKHSVVHLTVQTYEVALEYVGLMSLDNLK